MSEKAWFVYEKSMSGIWGPAVIYGDQPKRLRHEEHMMTNPIEVPLDCLSSDGSPMFGRLQAIYPPPQEREDG